MLISYKNNRLEKAIIAVNSLTAAVVTVSFAMLFGYDEPYLPARVLYTAHTVLLCVFIAEKIVRFFNTRFKLEYLRVFWFEIPFFIILLAALVGAGRWFGKEDPVFVRHFAVGLYLVLQVLIKVCRTVVNLAASGRNPTQTLIASFLVLITVGALLLMLPKSTTVENISFVDALFTSTSATCVTGLIVKDTGKDFSLMGQVIILALIQLGGLGIVVFGAVFALLLGQALTVRESVAMQDLLSARTLSALGKTIAFIFVGTLFIETLGAVSLLGVWDNSQQWAGTIQEKWFYSIFHSISAFCNAGFSLFNKSFIDYNRSWQIYLVICPLIVLGGLGFSVLYDLFSLVTDKVRRFFKMQLDKSTRLSMQAAKMRLQTKIVLTTSAALIVLGALAIMLFQHYNAGASAENGGILGAIFQSITARTAGFNTVDISKMSVSSRFILILLMFIGGSPGSTAGGIKTVTFAVVMMTAVAALRKRSEVEMFSRSIRIVIVGRAITVTLLFVIVLFTATLALGITERANSFDMSYIAFEAASALGTVGLTCGITGSLTTAGKLIIIAVMLIGRLGPLTLLAALTFNLKPAKFNYPEEAIIVG